MQPCGRLAREHSRAGGRADVRRGIGVGETHTLGRQSVNVRCLVECTAVTTEIPPTEIIGEDEQDIGRRCLGLRLLSFGNLADAQHEGGDDAGNDEIVH